MNSTDPAWLTYQYSDPQKLEIRIQTHREYTVGDDSWLPRLVAHLALSAGLGVLDVGCGHGSMHSQLVEAGARLVGLDRSFGMLLAARAHGRVMYLQGDVQELPFADATFERVLAAHVLFHIPRREQALAEMRRVIRPGGRVVISANGAETFQPLLSIHAEAAQAAGYATRPGPEAWFSLDHLPLVQSVFPGATRHEVRSALLFPTAEPALRFYATGIVDRIEDAPTDGSHRPRLLALVRDRIEAIVAAEGAFHVPKSTGFFVAEV